MLGWLKAEEIWGRGGEWCEGVCERGGEGHVRELQVQVAMMLGWLRAEEI